MDKFKIAGVEVTHLTHDSKTVQPGSCFFALDGGTTDGAKYVPNAIAAGAVVIVAKKGTEIDKPTVPVLYVDDVRTAMSHAAKRFHGDICDKMTIIGVTGTNGKTSCTYILRHLLSGGAPVGVIGTLGAFVGDECIEFGLTTPDPIKLHEIFARMYEMGVRTVAMEVSAHAIHYQKVAGLTFRAGMFTNLSQDHLDFFGTMERYAETKIGWVAGDSVKTPIVNIEDAYANRILDAREDARTYSTMDAGDIKFDGRYMAFRVGKIKFKSPLCGRFNVSNVLGCMAVARELGLPMRRIKRLVKTIPQIPGRFNVYRSKRGVVAIVDYAHSPDGLEKILVSARELVGRGGRLISVFGCGGDRDKAKREIMGRISGNCADFTIVTSDNPRSEDPDTIIAQIEAGLVTATTEDKYILNQDRADATRLAFGMAKRGDVIVIAGKGAETTQEIRGTFYPYSDTEIVRKYIQG